MSVAANLFQAYLRVVNRVFANFLRKTVIKIEKVGFYERGRTKMTEPKRWFCTLCCKRTIVKSNRPRHFLSKKHIAAAVKVEAAKGHNVTREEQYAKQKEENQRRMEIGKMRGMLREWMRILKRNKRAKKSVQ